MRYAAIGVLLSAAWVTVGCESEPKADANAAAGTRKDVTEAPPAVPADANAFGGHHYKVYEEDVSWHEARAKCEKMGGYLACVESAEEQQFIADLADGRYLFLGATDEEEEGEWKWVNGSPFSYTDWLEGQPNNSFGSEHYLSTFEGGGWNDATVSGREWWSPSGYICEWDR